MNRYRDRYGDKLRIIFVVPDYYESRPKKCMNGWGNVFLTIVPDGTALPCHTARMLPGLEFPNVKDHSIQKEDDLGGCRCQAYMLSGDMYAADPVCDKSPHRSEIDRALELAQRSPVNAATEKPLVFRDPKSSQNLSTGRDGADILLPEHSDA